MDLQEVADRLEIQDLMIDYCTALDAHDFDAMRELFVEDAVVDYTAMGGPKGHRDAIIDYLARIIPSFPRCQHFITNARIRVTGDSATGRTMVLNPMGMPMGEGQHQMAFYGLWYNDTFVRTHTGWKIQTRCEEYGFDFNVPASFQAFSEL